MKIVLASQNPGKQKEFQHLLSQFGIEVVLPKPFECEETENSFIGNARLKAQTLSSIYDDFVISDDSGLSIDLLDGRPGVLSARYAGEDTPYPDKWVKLLNELKPFPLNQWTAHFSCALVLMKKDKIIFETVQTLEGMITDKPRGEHGFGFDPIFYVPELDKTLAELPPEHKNKISHRAKALKSLVQFIAIRTREIF